MSRQNKQRKKAIVAAQFSKNSKGPNGTEPKHGKRKSWSQMGRKAATSNRGKQKDE